MKPETRTPSEHEKPNATRAEDTNAIHHEETRSVLQRAVTSEEFVRAVIVLLLTALLTGFIVPVVFSQIQATQARNDAIIQAQSKLFDDISDTILSYETLALDVTWFKTRSTAESGLPKRGFLKYNDRAVDLVAKWRAEVARSQTLASPSVSAKMSDFLLKVFKEQDTPMMDLYRTNARTELWENQHQKNIQMLEESNKLIAEIATDLKLSKQDLTR